MPSFTCNYANFIGKRLVKHSRHSEDLKTSVSLTRIFNKVHAVVKQNLLRDLKKRENGKLLVDTV